VGMGVMPHCVETPIEVTDLEVISTHPFIPIWRDLMLFLPYLPQWEPYTDLQFLKYVIECDFQNRQAA